MSQATTLIVSLSVFRLFVRMLLGVLMIAVCLLFGFGLTVMVWGCVVCGVAFVVLFANAVIRQRPRIVITPEGFTFYGPFGERSHRWSDIEGRFTVIKIGLFKVVAYHLTAECKVRLGKKPTSRYSGYDDVLLGAFRLSPDRLAELLNEQREQGRMEDAASRNDDHTGREKEEESGK